MCVHENGLLLIRLQGVLIQMFHNDTFQSNFGWLTFQICTILPNNVTLQNDM